MESDSDCDFRRYRPRIVAVFELRDRVQPYANWLLAVIFMPVANRIVPDSFLFLRARSARQRLVGYLEAVGVNDTPPRVTNHVFFVEGKADLFVIVALMAWRKPDLLRGRLICKRRR